MAQQTPRIAIAQPPAGPATPPVDEVSVQVPPQEDGALDFASATAQAVPEFDFESATVTPDDEPRSVSDSFADAWDEFKKTQPVQPKAMVDALKDPVAAIKAIGEAQGAVGEDAMRSFQNGDYLRGTRKLFDYLIPFFGPVIDKEVDAVERGEYARALGGTLGLLANFIGEIPRAMQNPVAKAAKAVGASPTPPPAPVSPKVAFAAERGIPLTRGETTGSRLLLNAEKVSEDSTIAGTVLGGKLRGRQVEAMSRVGDDLATEVSPQPATRETAGTAAQHAASQVDTAVSQAYGATANKIANRVAPSSVSPVQAGERLGSGLTSKMEELGEIADESYEAFRAFEDDPAHAREVVVGHEDSQMLTSAGQPAVKVPVTKVVALPVELGPVKSGLRAVFDDLSADPTWTLVRKQASPGYAALEQLVTGPDAVPISRAERMLSAIKSIAREHGGVAKLAVAKLDHAIQRAAAQAGPEVVEALRKGRAATKLKYATAEVLAALEGKHAEPAKMFESVVSPRDTALNLLRDVARETPKSIPAIARAYVDRLFGETLTTGALDVAKVRDMAKKWSALGAETKKILFPDARVVQQLDQYFMHAARVADEPVVPSFGIEPVKAFDALVPNGDTGIWRLSALEKIAPAVPKLLGRAWLSNKLEFATANGRFDHGAALRASWDKLGRRTKRILFGDNVSNIDAFMRLADEIQWKDTNSMTVSRLSGLLGKVTFMVEDPLHGAVATFTHEALATMLFEPRIARAVVKSLETPKAKAAQAASVSARILNFARTANLASSPATRLPAAASSKEAVPTQADTDAGSADDFLEPDAPPAPAVQ